jgi:hypothetical protein
MYTDKENPKEIYILANKAKAAQSLLSDIKGTYEELSPYLKQGISEYNKTSITFENGSKIVTGATTDDSGRGESISFLLLDEFAHVSRHVAEEFYASVTPTISQGGKIAIISTPKGNTNLFARLFSDAKKGLNGFVAYDIPDWRVIPRADKNGKLMDPEKFKRVTLKAVGLPKWNQEFEAKFLGSAKTLIDGAVLEKIGTYIDDFDPRYDDGALKVWEKPQPNHIYVLSGDVAMGAGGDYSVLHIFDITNLEVAKQVAVFSSNEVDPYDLADKVLELAVMYNRAYAIVENNTYGHEVCRRLYDELEYENIYKEPRSKVWGIACSVRTKGRGGMLLKKYMESGAVIIKDKGTYDELCSFIEVAPDSYKAEKGTGIYDDRVMALMWMAYFIGSDFWRDWGEQIRKEAKGLISIEDGGEEERENFAPVIFGDDFSEENVFDDEDYV